VCGTYVLVGDLNGDRVSGVGSLSLLPPNKASVHASGSAAGALAGNGGELAGILLLGVVQLGQGGDKAGKTSRRGRKARTGGEGVVGGDSDTVLGPVLLLHNNLAGGGIDLVLGELSDLSQAGLTAAVDLDLVAVQPHHVTDILVASSDGGDSMQVLLVEGNTRRGVHGSVELDIALTPVLDHRNW